tara:strand:+ start:6624 stop:6827 length:204 start_codon:yes stop_codon:yes gene_type:complete
MIQYNKKRPVRKGVEIFLVPSYCRSLSEYITICKINIKKLSKEKSKCFHKKEVLKKYEDTVKRYNEA